jgi:hypothetical protein
LRDRIFRTDTENTEDSGHGESGFSRPNPDSPCPR